ncbi:phosphoribosyl pyrophosphate synthetase-associated protein [Aphelenchoides avenae]|nr:phosphoribosyl pyrophosphate synthetase-associated protein [Aphelenchus avenae]
MLSCSKTPRNAFLDRSLHIATVQPEDAGEYRCDVVVRECNDAALCQNGKVDTAVVIHNVTILIVTNTVPQEILKMPHHKFEIVGILLTLAEPVLRIYHKDSMGTLFRAPPTTTK